MTDRERLLELAEAVLKVYVSMSIIELGEAIDLALNVVSRPAKEAFKELDKESEEWDNEGGK